MKNSAFAGAVLNAVLSIWASPVEADVSKELAKKGRAAWSSFVCASLASHLDEKVEHERLFEYGYEQGKIFVEAVFAGEVTREDIDNEVPIGVSVSLEGPTTDFMLGRIYEVAVEYASDSIWDDHDSPVDQDTRRTLAKSRFTEANCRLIGPQE
jgi:hypothetical protein